MSTLQKRFTRIACLTTLLASSLVADEAHVIHIAPDGNDINPGTREKPLATLYAAQQKVRGLPRTGRIIVSIADGSYYLDKPHRRLDKLVRETR